VQLYPTVPDSALTFTALQDFSLSGTGVEIDIVEIEKPVLNYSDDTYKYTCSFLGKDSSGLFYIFNTTFNYLNGILTNITNNMLQPSIYTYSSNFANPSADNIYQSFVVAGSAGSIINGVYCFGNF
jgi:hypothetical protein